MYGVALAESGNAEGRANPEEEEDDNFISNVVLIILASPFKCDDHMCKSSKHIPQMKAVTITPLCPSSPQQRTPDMVSLRSIGHKPEAQIRLLATHYLCDLALHFPLLLNEGYCVHLFAYLKKKIKI